jgi:predicted nucleic acid-binding Zn ribbon protein
MAVIPKPFGKSFKIGPPKSGPRQRILTQWRGVDVDALDKTSLVRTRKVADIMPKILVDLRMDRRRAEAEITKVWSHLIDPRIVEHAQPTGLNKGTLFVTVDSSPWLDEIVRYRRKEILNRLQHSFGADLITRISFRVG